MKQLFIIIILVQCFFVIADKSFAQELRFGVEFTPWENKTFETGLKAEIRNDNTTKQKRYFIIQPKAAYEISKRFSVETGIRYSNGIKIRTEKDEFPFDKFRINAGIKYKTKHFDNDIQLKARLRYLQYIEKGDIDHYISHKLELKYSPLKNSDAYIALEPFYNIHSNRIDAIRIHTGGKFTVFQNKIELYLINELSEKRGEMVAEQAIGFSYQF